MKSPKIQLVLYRRKNEGKTDYKTRLALLKSGLPRLVIRKFNKNITAQIINYNDTGDKIEVQAHSKELEKFGWKNSKTNLPASYLVGLLLGKKSKIKKAILDVGLVNPTKGSKIYSLLKGCLDAGMDIPHNVEILPTKERILGKHIQGKDIEQDFNLVKEKIIKG